MTDDLELLRRYAANGSEEAFAALVQRHLSLVYFAALRRTNGDVHLAKDITQLVFTALAREGASLGGRTVLAGWLFVTTRHAAANAMRSEYRRKAREQEAQIMQEPAESDADLERLRSELDSLLDELGETDRNAVLLRFFESQPYAEIATKFRISEDAARMRVERALEKMRGLLSRRGITSTAAALGGIMATQTALGAPAGLAATVTGTALLGGTTTATVFSVFGFMLTNKMMVGIAAVVAFAAAGSALYETQAKRQLTGELAFVSQEREMLRLRSVRQVNEMNKEREKARDTEKRYAALEKNVAEAAAGKGARSGPGQVRQAEKAAANASTPNKMEILFSNPEYAVLELKRLAASLGLQYGRFYRKLDLSPAQIKEFESLMLEQQQSLFDVFAAARANGVSLVDPSMRNLNNPAYGEIDAKLRSLLGADGYATYQAYSKTGMARAAADSLASNLYYTEAPLTARQADELSQIIAANTGKPTGGGFLLMSPQTDWVAVYAQAKTILSASQLATLQAANEGNQLALQLSALSDKLMIEAASAPPKG